MPKFLSQATPAQQLQFRRTGQLPAPWGDQVLASGISSAFVAVAVAAAVAAAVAVVAAVIALVVIQVRAFDLERLQGGTMSLVPAEERATDTGGAASSVSPSNPVGRDGPPPAG